MQNELDMVLVDMIRILIVVSLIQCNAIIIQDLYNES